MRASDFIVDQTFARDLLVPIPICPVNGAHLPLQRRFTALLQKAVCVFAWFGYQAVAQAPSSGDQSLAERFQRFSKDPGAVEVIYRKTQFEGHFMPGDPRGPTKAKLTRVYHLIWQPDGFYHREHASPGAIDDLKIAGYFFTRFRDRVWDVDGGKRSVLYRGPSIGIENMVLSAMRGRLFQIGEVLNGGIWLFAP